jgi:hypothetical protein
VVIEPGKQTVAGAIDLMLWAREGESEGKAGAGKRAARKPLEEKESYRWAERAVTGRERLSGVPKATVVQDREGDIYESCPLLKEHDVNWVIRASHDRKAKWEEGSGRASEYLAGKEAAGSYLIEVARRGEKKRSVKLEVRFGKITVEQPGGRAKDEREKYPGEIEMRVV